MAVISFTKDAQLPLGHFSIVTQTVCGPLAFEVGMLQVENSYILRSLEGFSALPSIQGQSSTSLST